MNGRPLFAGLVALALLSGCDHVYDVDFELISEAREGQVVDPEGIELIEGHAVGVKVIPIQNGADREGWTVRASSNKGSIVNISETLKPNVFVLQGVTPGKAEIEFVLQGRHDVFVPVEVVVRPDWQPSAPTSEPEPGFGGAGGAAN